MEKAAPLRNSIAMTAIATVSIMVLIAALWVSMLGPQTVSAIEILLSTVIAASLIFPLVYLWVNARAGTKKSVSPRFMVWMSILWMMVSVIGIAANLWSGLSEASQWTMPREIEFWAVLAMFCGMFVSSLIQLSAAADFQIRESAAQTSRARYGYRPRTA